MVTHAFEPLVPLLTPPQEKMLVLFVALTAKVDMVWSPGILSVTVTVFVLDAAVKPTGKVVWQVAL